MTHAVIEALRAALGNGAVLAGDEIPPKHGSDWSRLPSVSPLAVVYPTSTREVAEVLRLCHRYRQAVTPQGGLTGLVGGARPSPHSIALSLERLTGVEAVDAAGATMTVRAGTTLEVVQKVAEEAGLLFALDIGSRGSCTIGGNLATNAGGNRVLRYGMARDLVLGLEVVLADGTVLSSMNAMVKNNTGLDLKQMFIGTEGTLGVITRAILRLHPRPVRTMNAFCRCPDFNAVLRLLGSDKPSSAIPFYPLKLCGRAFTIWSRRDCRSCANRWHRRLEFTYYWKPRPSIGKVMPHASSGFSAMHSKTVRSSTR